MKTGIVLEGGGVRGIYTAGVLDIFMEENITFDGLIGVSAGAVHGCSYLSNQKGRGLRYYLEYCGDYRFMSFKNWLKTGNVVDTEFSYHQIPEKLVPYDYNAFKQNKTPFYAVCANLETGDSEYLQITDMFEEIDIIRASASLPYFSQIVEFGGMKLLDGGCTDAIPLKAFQKMGYERNVVVLTRPKGYVKKPEMKGMAGIVYRKYPKFADVLKRRHEAYNNTIAEIEKAEKAGDTFVIRPSQALPASRMEHNPEKIQATYNIGAEDAKNVMESLKNWLAE